MRKTFHSLILSSVLALSMIFTACGAKREAGPADRSALPPSLQELSFEEHLDISIGYWDIENMVKASEPDGITQYIEGLFNITIHPVSVSWSNYKERYQILSATESLPDVFATLTLSSNDTNDSATFVDMIETGAIRPLPQDLSSFPNVEQLLKSVSYTQYTDGRFYAIPRVSFSDPILSATDAAMLVRRDWMENLGLQDPQSFQEFAELAAAFAHDDPDGNGIDDTLGYNVNSLSALGKWVMLGIAPQCNVYSWVEEDSRFVPSWATEDFKNVVSAYRLLYETGGLDPDFFTKSPFTAVEDFASGRLGALEYKSSPSALKGVKDKWDAMNDKSFEECVDVLPIFPAADGVRYSNSSSTFWSESYLSAAADDAKTQRILALWEFLLSDEGRELCRFGIRDVDYRITSDGTYEYLLDTSGEAPGTALFQKYPSLSLFYDAATWGGSWEDFEENEANLLQYGEACVRLAHKSAVWYRDNTTQLDRPYEFLLRPKDPSGQFGTSQALDAFVTCIIGNDDPLEMWEQALDDMENQGLREYIDRQNEKGKRQAP